MQIRSQTQVYRLTFFNQESAAEQAGLPTPLQGRQTAGAFSAHLRPFLEHQEE